MLTLVERKNLLNNIIQVAPREGTMIKWKEYFAGHPDEAKQLGYDSGGKSPEWNRNNVLARHLQGRVKGRSKKKWKAKLKPYKVKLNDIEPTPQPEQDLKAKLKVAEAHIVELRQELDDAKDIAYELLLQLKRAKGAL